MPCRRHATASSKSIALLLPARTVRKSQVWRLCCEESALGYHGRTCQSQETIMLEFETVRLEIPSDANIILGQTHFIKTVEDMYEAVVNTVPQAKFGLAFNESSGPASRAPTVTTTNSATLPFGTRKSSAPGTCSCS